MVALTMRAVASSTAYAQPRVHRLHTCKWCAEGYASYSTKCMRCTYILRKACDARHTQHLADLNPADAEHSGLKMHLRLQQCSSACSVCGMQVACRWRAGGVQVAC